MGFVQGRSMRLNSYDFDRLNVYSYTKPYTQPSGTAYIRSELQPYTQPSGVGVVHIRSANQWKAYFDATKQNKKLLVIEFTAAWCGPCRHMELPIKTFAAMYTDVQFIRIDVDELASVARQFDACTLPAFSLVKKGKEVDRVAGVKKSELQYKIEKHRA